MTENRPDLKKLGIAGGVPEALASRKDGANMKQMDVRRLIERMKGSSIEDKKVMLAEAVSSVDALLANPSLSDTERGEISKVKDSLQTEIDAIAKDGPVPPQVKEPGVQ